MRGFLAAAAMSAVAAIGVVVTVASGETPPPGQQQAASIRGVVHDEGGNVVPGARVILWPALGAPEGADPETYAPPEGWSATDGTFRLDVDAGVFHVLVRLPGYQWGHRLGVTVGADESIDVGALVLRRGASIAGTLRYSDGEPAGGFAVGLYLSTDDPWFLPGELAEQPPTTTPADGTFHFDGLAPGGRVDLWIQTNPSRKQYETFSVGEVGEVARRLEFVLERPRDAATFVVEVVSETGEPIEDARLYISRIPRRPSSGGGIARARFTALPGGRFEALPMEPGLQRLIVRAPMHRPQERADIQLSAGDNGTIRFELERVPSAAVAVILTTAEGTPVPGHEVRISRLGPLSRESLPVSTSGLDVSFRLEKMPTNDAGEYVFDNVPQGRYRIYALDHALGRATRDIDVAPGAAPFPLSFPEAEGPIGTIRVRVVDSNGIAIPNAHVEVDRRPRPYRTNERGQTGADGTFAFEALVDDAMHAFRVRAVGYKSFFAEHRLDEQSVDREFIFALQAGDTPGNSTVTGRIVGLDPAVLHRVTLSSGPSYVRADGSFVIGGLAPGQHELTIYTDMRLGGMEVPFMVTIPRDGDTVDVGEVNVGGFRVTGIVYYQGEPMQNGGMSLSPAARGRRYSNGSASLIDGRFTLGRVQEGRYHLKIRYDGWGRIHHQVIDVESDIDLELRLGAAMASGTVVDAETAEPLDGGRLQIGYVCNGPDCNWWSHERPGGLEIGPDGGWRGGPLEAGTWRLRLARPGYVPLDVRIEVNGGVDVDVPLEMIPTPGLDLVFETATGVMPQSVRATLLDDTGNEIARQSFYDYSGLPLAHWDGAPPGTWTLESFGHYARTVRQQVTIPGPPVTVSVPMEGLMLARIPALEETITLAILVVLDSEGQPVTGYMADGTPVVEWIAPGSGEIYARRLPPGNYTARVTTGDRIWEKRFEVEPFVLTTVTLRGPGR